MLSYRDSTSLIDNADNKFQFRMKADFKSKVDFKNSINCLELKFLTFQVLFASIFINSKV